MKKNVCMTQQKYVYFFHNDSFGFFLGAISLVFVYIFTAEVATKHLTNIFSVKKL